MSLEDFSEQQKEPEIKELFRKNVSFAFFGAAFLNSRSKCSLSSIHHQDLSKFLSELGSCKVVNEKTAKLSGIVSRMLDIENTHFSEVPKLFDEGLSLSGDKEATRKLISALIERCIEASIEQDGACSSFGFFLRSKTNFLPSVQTAEHYEFNRESFSSKINNYLKLLKEPDSQLEIIYSVVKVVADDLKSPKGNWLCFALSSE